MKIKFTLVVLWAVLGLTLYPNSSVAMFSSKKVSTPVYSEEDDSPYSPSAGNSEDYDPESMQYSDPEEGQCVNPQNGDLQRLTDLANLLEVQKTSKNCIPNHEINFGVLVANPYFHIYRSTGLGHSGLSVLRAHLDKNHLPLPSKIIYMNAYGYKYTPADRAKKVWADIKKLFGKRVHHAGLFAKEQEEAAKLAQKENAEPWEVATERAWEAGAAWNFDFKHKGIGNFYVDGINPNNPKKTGKGGNESVYNVLEEILTNTGATDFHCKGGIHRTGMIALLIRYLQGGEWTKDQGAHEVAVKRDGKKTKVILRNAAELEYYHHNKNNFRVENLAAVREIANEPRFRCLADKFSCALNATSEHPTVSGCYQDMNSQNGCSVPAEIQKTEANGKTEINDRYLLISECKTTK